MGILNVTPDSFYAESRVRSETDIIRKAEKMLEEGADILDLGGYSSRPGAENVSIEEEKTRIIPAIELIRKEFPQAVLSLDTFRSEVARDGLNVGADIINDIGAGILDPEMPKVVAEFKVPYIIMHMRGTPQTMQTMTNYDNITQEMLLFFSERLNFLTSQGIHDIILDPGFGFSKTVEQNYELIEKLALFQMFDVPILAGISRKSFIQKRLNVNVENASAGTEVLHAQLLKKGAQILRTHDVAATKRTIEQHNALA